MAHFQGPQRVNMNIFTWDKNEIAWKKSVTVLVTFVKDLPLLIILPKMRILLFILGHILNVMSILMFLIFFQKRVRKAFLWSGITFYDQGVSREKQIKIFFFRN